MNYSYAPRYVRQIGDNYIVWFEATNTYIILDDFVFELLNTYLKVEGELTSFKKIVKRTFSLDSDKIDSYYKELTLVLKSCHEQPSNDVITSNEYTPIEKVSNVEYYVMSGKKIQISYGSSSVRNLLHPQLAHAATSNSNDTFDARFEIFLHKEFLHINKDDVCIGSFPANDYHLMQGKFAISLVCTLTNTAESDWLATFHASTFIHNDQGIMLIGESGNGKSTLTALLMASGYDVIADDFTPMLNSTKKLYAFPSAISIKEGAFDLLVKHYKYLEDYESINLNNSKGAIKYLPITNNSVITNNGISCHTIIHVKYKEGATLQLEKTPLEKILPILISDSWISPKPQHAISFLDWLENITSYSLTYSDYQEVLDVLENLKKYD